MVYVSDYTSSVPISTSQSVTTFIVQKRSMANIVALLYKRLMHQAITMRRHCSKLHKNSGRQWCTFI